MGFREFYEEGDGATPYSFIIKGFPGGAVVKNPLANAGDARDTGLIPGSGRDPLEKEMATHSSVIAWEIPWTEESDGLQSLVLQESQTQLSK